jgi:hypothetical protein
MGSFFPKMVECSPAQLQENIKNWTLAMADIGYGEAEVAVLKLVRSFQYERLKVADIILAVKAISKANIPSPEQAVQEVNAEVRRCGQYKAPEFSHPYILEAVRTIGWWTFCTTEFDLSARFMKIYESIVTRHQEQAENETVLVLAGMMPKMLGGGRG